MSKPMTKTQVMPLIRAAEKATAEIARNLRDSTNPQCVAPYREAIGANRALCAVLYALHSGDAVNLRIMGE